MATELEELRASVKKEVTQQAAKWLVATAVVAIALAISGWWLYLKPKLIELAGGVPPGLVAAFDRPNSCPSGWKPFDEAAGRTVIGVGKGPELTERRYRDEGGTETHRLTVDELPSHTHQVIQMIGDNNVDGVDSTTRRSGDHHNEARRSGAAGGGNVHNNMPPFIALQYCKKQ